MQVITSVETVKNSVDDAAVLAKSIPVLKEETELETAVADGELTAQFDAEKCAVCPLKDRCTAFKSVIKIDTKRRWIDERRSLFKTEEYQSLCRMRPPVEGLMEKLKPKYLRGRTLFRGLQKSGTG